MDTVELQKTWNAYFRQKTHDNKNKLIIHYYDYVIKIAKALAYKLNYRINWDELASFGVDGLYKSLDRFDPELGFKFQTYASIRIKGAMLDALRKEDWVPRSVRLREADIESTKQQLEAERGESVPLSEILEYLDIDEVEYNKQVNKFSVSSVASIEATTNNEVDSDSNKKDFNCYLEAINNSSPESDLLRREFINKLLGKRFNKIERKVVYYYYYERLTMKEIANELGVSESRVSQMHQDILDKLRRRIESNPDYFGSDIFGIIESCNDCDSLF